MYLPCCQRACNWNIKIKCVGMSEPSSEAYNDQEGPEKNVLHILTITLMEL